MEWFFFSSGVQVNNIPNSTCGYLSFPRRRHFGKCHAMVPGSITNATASINQAIGSFGNNSTDSQPWGRLAQILYYNRHLTNDEIICCFTSNLFSIIAVEWKCIIG